MTKEEELLPASVAKVGEGLVRVETKVDSLRTLIEVQINNQTRQIEHLVLAIENARAEAKEQVNGARASLQRDLDEHKEDANSREQRIEIALDYMRDQGAVKYKQVDDCLEVHGLDIAKLKVVSGIAAALGVAGLGALVDLVAKSFGA